MLKVIIIHKYVDLVFTFFHLVKTNSTYLCKTIRILKMMDFVPCKKKETGLNKEAPK